LSLRPFGFGNPVGESRRREIPLIRLVPVAGQLPDAAQARYLIVQLSKLSDGFQYPQKLLF
jgi:hypothetical protein